jgi:bifunctional non-homologous end joining protein LigD
LANRGVIRSAFEPAPSVSRRSLANRRICNARALAESQTRFYRLVNALLGGCAAPQKIISEGPTVPAASSTAVTAPRRRRATIAKPGFLDYLNPTEVDDAPTGDGWVHEIKWDGYRAQAHLQDGHVQMFTRKGNDWTEKFGPLPAAIAELDARDAILDGEVVATDDKGVSDFHALRRQLGAAHPRLVYQVFDLLWLDGTDLRPLPLGERKARLQKLLDDAPTLLLSYVEPLGGADGRAVLKAACGLELEGVVSKRLESPYRAGRSRDWLKVKCEVSETFIVAGFSEDRATGRLDGIYLGRAGAGGALTYAGQVENGIDGPELERRLRPLVTRQGAAGQAQGEVDDPRGAGRGVLPEQDGRRQNPASLVQGLP